MHDVRTYADACGEVWTYGRGLALRLGEDDVEEVRCLGHQSDRLQPARRHFDLSAPR